MRHLLLIISAALFLLSCSGSNEMAKETRTPYDPVKLRIKDIDICSLPAELTVLSDPRSGLWSVEFYDLDRKETLFEYNKNKNP